MEGLVTLVFFKTESKNLASWGVFSCKFFKKLYVYKFKASVCHYDVIIGIFQGPATLPFLKVEAQNLVSWGILTCSLKGQYFISITSFTDTL